MEVGKPRFNVYIGKATGRKILPDDEIDNKVGEVVDNETGIAYPIYYSHKTYEKYNRRIGCCPDGDPPYIFIDDSFFILRDKKPDYFEALIMHEMYHMLYDKKPQGLIKEPKEKIDEIRKDYIRKGKVMPNEIAADRFAASIVGKQRMINAIKEMKKMRKRRGDSDMESAIEECNMRIELLEADEM